MTPDPISSSAATPVVECRTCGAGAPVHEHFCTQCSRILSLGRHGDYFAFLGLPRRLGLDLQDLERRFRDLSRQLHPDFFYNATPAERLASLERSSYLNDAYRTLRDPGARIEHLLTLEGLGPTRVEGGPGTVPPPSLLEEVFELNEQLDEIRELREGGADPEAVHARVEAAAGPIEARRAAYEARLAMLTEQWDRLVPDGAPADRRATLTALRACLLERNYINNLLATIQSARSPVSKDPAHG